ncbi:P22 phage major capsid protein family protein [Bacillus subtilis]|uniref:P22 phage major capsid protein family protein n=1 Tax=Bacillus subtilis TaxID=1423 RepID=UPI002E2216A0|nr:P22 phage major capsid protein family protein [Bacillus subtilis]
MTNNVLTQDIIAKEALMVLENNLVLANLVHKDYGKEFVSGVGDTVTIRKPNTFKTTEFKNEIEIQDLNESKTTVELDTHLDVSFSYTSKDLTLNISDFSKQFIQPALMSMANDIDVRLAKLHKDVPFIVGDGGILPTTVKNVIEARKVLNQNKAPLAGRNLVVGANTEADLLNLEAFHSAEKVGDAGTALRTGSLGQKFGFDIFMDQNIQDHEPGNLTATDGDLMVKGSIAAGSSTLTLTTDGTALTGGLVEGDILVIGDKFYAVAQKAESSGKEIAVSLKLPTISTIDDKEKVKVVGEHSANLAFHKNAFAFVSRPIALPTDQGKSSILNYNGLSIRTVSAYDIRTKSNIMSFDMICGFKTLTPELAVKMIGQ